MSTFRGLPDFSGTTQIRRVCAAAMSAEENIKIMLASGEAANAKTASS
jgi:hypothetical protein